MVQKEGTEYLLCGLVTDVMTNVDVTFRGVDWPWFILNYPNQSQLIVINPQLPCGIGKTNCQESHCYFMKSNKTFWNSQSLLKGLHVWSSSVLLNVIVPHWCHFTVFLSTILTFRQCVLFFFLLFDQKYHHWLVAGEKQGDDCYITEKETIKSASVNLKNKSINNAFYSFYSVLSIIKDLMQFSPTIK